MEHIYFLRFFNKENSGPRNLFSNNTFCGKVNFYKRGPTFSEFDLDICYRGHPPE